jgi:hypothetical protein
MDLQEWESLFHYIIQRVSMNLWHRGKVSKIPLYLMIRKREGLLLSEIHEQTLQSPN